MQSSNRSNKQGIDLIRLNDVGVFLLQRHCYQQSFATFRDAFQILKRTVPEFKGCVKNNGNSSFENPKSLLSKANDRLLSMEPFPHSAGAPAFQCSLLSMDDLKSSEEIDLIVDKLQQQQQHNFEYVAICIGSFALKNEHIRADIWAAIITYNFGVARQAYATALRHQGHQRRPILENIQRVEARRLLELSEEILNRICSEINEDKTSYDQVVLYQIQVIRMVVLLGIHLQVIGTSLAKKVEKKLSEIHSEVQCLEISKTHCVSAPAA